MSSDVALRIEGLGKRYTIRHKDHDHVTLAQSALHRLRHPRGGSAREDFWALRDVSFEVPRGQVLGVIGHNGAGKSTLLKILSRITPPSTGRVEVFGRIGSLLEVGTGFHPELTGRENIYLNGSILGMKNREIDRQFDAIVDFSGVEKFLDTPVKRYSSGMYVRLAFAVAAHLDTEILLMDEVLAVGDAEFQAKCLGKMGEVARGGRTVIFVSHNMAAVGSLCRSALLLHSGSIVADGSTASVLSAYEAARSELMAERIDLTAMPHFGTGSGSRQVTLTSLSFPLGGPTFSEREPITIDLTYRCDANLKACFGVGLVGADQVPVGVAFSDEVEIEPTHDSTVRLTIPHMDAVPGDYRVSVSVGLGNSRIGSTLDIDGVGTAAVVRVLPTTSGAQNWSRVWGWHRLGPLTVESLAPLQSETR